MKVDREVIIKRGYVLREEHDKLGKKFLRKVDATNRQGGDGEGFWVTLLSEEDLKRYDNDSIGKEIYGVLSNNLVYWFPNPTLGLVAKFQTKGKNRPHAYFEDMSDGFNKICNDYREYIESLKSEGDK